MKLSLASGSLIFVAASLVAAQNFVDATELFARKEYQDSVNARDYSSDSLAHAVRTLDHVRRLSDDHAEFVARALDEFEGLHRRAPNKDGKEPKTGEWIEMKDMSKSQGGSKTHGSHKKGSKKSTGTKDKVADQLFEAHGMAPMPAFNR